MISLYMITRLKLQCIFEIGLLKVKNNEFLPVWQLIRDIVTPVMCESDAGVLCILMNQTMAC